MARQRGANRSRVEPSLLYRTSSRVLVIDEDLNKRLATELKRRLRPSHHILEFLSEGTGDPDVLRFIAARFDDAVFVTGDNKMPVVHEKVVRETAATLAIVAPCLTAQDPNEDAHEREIVHRWAHKIHEQPTGSLKLYSLTGGVQWKPKKR